MQINNVVITGNISGKLILKNFQNGELKAIRGIIKTHDYKGVASYIPFIYFGPIAETIYNNYKGGEHAELIGRITSRKYINKEGVEVTSIEVIAEKLSVSKPYKADPTESEEAPSASNAPIDDLPF